MRDHHPTFEQVYVRLRERGLARGLSGRGTEYTVGRLAVKVINHCGDEVLKVLAV
jgi:hypothetical protein